MNADIVAVARECLKRSHDGSITFPEIVAKLAAVDVEHYEVDLLRGDVAYFTSDGRWHAEPLPAPAGEVAALFAGPDIAEAVQATQQGRIDYREFLRRIEAAGCARYFAYIAGRNVTYLGRRGEAHVERFPGGL